jgi:hypothetical protein
MKGPQPPLEAPSPAAAFIHWLYANWRSVHAWAAVAALSFILLIVFGALPR